MKKDAIEDYYGTKFEVEVLYKSAGAFVYMDRLPTEEFLKAGEQASMDRLSPDQAENLARRLIAAAKEIRP